MRPSLPAMAQKTKSTLLSRRAALAASFLALALLAACGGQRTEEDAATAARKPKPVSGVVDTGTGVALDFPEGWAEMPTQGRIYTKYYENKERQLSLGLSDFPTNRDSLWTLGEQVKRRLSNGKILESGPVTIDGHEAYRVVSELKTETGQGFVIGTVILRSPDRAVTVFLFSTHDEREGQRVKMESLLSTIDVQSL